MKFFTPKSITGGFKVLNSTWLSCCFLIVLLLGILSGNAQTSVQNFGTGTATQTTQTGSTSFIPAPTSGTTWARAGAVAPNAPIVISSASNPLGTTGSYIKAAASSTTSVAKISPWVGYTGGTEFYTSFKLLLGDASGAATATSGIWTFYQGAGAMYSDANDFAGAQVFTALRFTFGAGSAIALSYRLAGAFATTGLTTTALSSATVYTVEIVGNNKNSGTISYSYNGVAQTVAVQKFDLYLNGTKIGDDLGEALLPAGTAVASGTFIGVSSTSNTANVFVDDAIVYNAVPAFIGTSVPTVTTDATPAAISTITATLGGNVTFDGGSAVLGRGVVYSQTSLNASPSIAGANVTNGTATGTTGPFTINAASLPVNTQISYRAYATNSIGTSYGGASATTFYTLANTPNAPTVNAATSNSLNVAIGTGDGNPSNTQYAIQETGSGNYVQADGSLAGTAVWQTAAAWSTITVTGLAASTNYTFQVKARNTANVETAFSTGTTASTTAAAAQNQTITFNPLSNKTYGDGTFTLTATASSGLTVSYISSNTSVASVSGNTVTILAPGTTNIIASQSGNASYNPAPNVTQSLTVDPKNLTVSNAVAQNKTYDGTTAAVITGATLNGVVGTDNVTVSGGGNFVTANAGMGITVNAALSLGGTNMSNYTLTQPSGLSADITPATQTITFNALPNKTIADAPFTLTASASSGLTVTYSSSNPSVASVSGNTVTINGIGSTTITASQAGNGNYQAATSVQRTQTVTAVPSVVTYNFGTTTGTAAPTAGVPVANLSFSNISQGHNNGTTVLLSTTSPSSGYTGASGTFNAGAAAFTGALNTSTSTYFEFTLTPSAGYKVTLASISFGSRATSTGPQAYSLRSSIDGYTTDVATGTTLANSAWALRSPSTTSTASAFGQPVTFRLFGYSGTGSAGAGTANWRIDDVSLGVLLDTPPVCTGTPVAGTASGSATICSGSGTTLTLNGYSDPNVSGGIGIQWYSSLNNVNFSPVNAATNATLNTGSLTQTTYYYAIVTCSGSGLSATSNTVTVTVTPNVNPGIVTGTSPLCIGATATYSSNGDMGGTWSSTFPAIASVDAGTGFVTALSAGNTDITYTISTGCGSPAAAIQTLTVNPNYTITASAGANGSISPNGTTTLCSGLSQTYSITPAACYSIADVLVDGTSVGAVATYTFTNVTASHTISATFSLNTYTIMASSGANGTVSPPGTSTFNCGDNEVYTITPAACYSVADVLVDGMSVGTGQIYGFTNITSNHTISATFIRNTYTITANANANGTITPSGQSSINCGDNATYTITPDACYSITNVLVDGTPVGAVSTYTFTNVTTNHTINVTFSLSAYTISAISGANGSVTPAGTTTVNCGANQTYTITPAACYSIADVLVDGTSVGAIGTYTFNNVTVNHTISATFAQTTYTITSTAGSGGSISPSGAVSVACGGSQEFDITPDPCYHITDVVLDGISNGALSSYTFNNVMANHTISVTFALTQYSITSGAGAGGTISPSGTTVVNCGGPDVTFTITPDGCHIISSVVVDGFNQGAVSSVTVSSFYHTVYANFSLNSYTITATSGANGTVTPAGAPTVNCGDNTTYTITPAACYSIADVLVDGTSVGAVGTYTFTNVTANHTISATFVQTTYTITATSGANGTVTPAGATTVNCGANQTYTITPAACYSIANVIVDGSSVGAVGTYTFTNVTANHTISATFSLNTYTITATSGANGTVTPAGATTVNCGANQTYTITPAACYSIANVIVDGSSVGAVGTYTFTNVTANHTISATFTLNTYTITATSGANGTVTPAGATTVNCGANATYTITANGGYAVQNVIVDGVSQGAITTYTFTNVTANHTISAIFVNNTSFTITASAGANGTISPNGVTNVASGGSQSYTITPATCYHVQDVLVDGTSVGAVTTYSFTNVTANHTISASFAINAALAAPTVTGPVNVCPYIGTGTQVTYTATSAGATGFTWVIPPSNVTIVSGQGTANLTVTFQNGFAAQGNKQLRVTATSSCGNSTQTLYVLVAQTPGTPGQISGNTNICPIINTAATYTYTINSILAATSYMWTVPAGATIVSHPYGTGANDTAITVSFDNSFVNGTFITVASANQCNPGGSAARSLALTRPAPSTPGLISGPGNACPYMAPGGTAATYSIAAVSGATSYTWTIPGGATITGQGTTTISFTYPSNFTSGTIMVTATNGCGTSAARSLSVSKLTPSAPGPIDVIQTGSCPNRVFTYTISSTPANSTSVQWTVPVGATIVSGQGSNSITVSYPSTAVNGNITAQAVSNCGNSSVRSVAVRLPACDAGPPPPFAKTKTGDNKISHALEINVFPNPSLSDFKLQVISAGKEKVNVIISDMQGRELKNFVIMPYESLSIGSDLKAGSYILELRQGDMVKTTKLIKF